MRPVLVVVHPGSACGSADFSLGGKVGAAMREALRADLDSWTGDILVLDGALSRELRKRSYSAYGQAIERAVARCGNAGFLAVHEHGCDNVPPLTRSTLGRLVADGTLDPATMAATMTGAWFDPMGAGGCINDAQAYLESKGFETEVRESCAYMDEALEDAQDARLYPSGPAR